MKIVDKFKFLNHFKKYSFKYECRYYYYYNILLLILRVCVKDIMTPTGAVLSVGLMINLFPLLLMFDTSFHGKPILGVNLIVNTK